jgi:4'-phosphopantetheinyl transferase EntD
MIADLVPGGVATAELRRDLGEVTLFPEEEAIVVRSTERRRREFSTARVCARRALERLGAAAVPIPAGGRGEPLWPLGIVGSITHCDRYRACAVARTADIASIGIDAEVHVPLRKGVIRAIASAREMREVARCDRLCLDKVLFSAKEAVYKSWFPLTGRSLEFDAVDVSFDLEAETFRAVLLVPGPVVNGDRLREFHGRWQVDRGVVLSVVVVSGD